MGFLKRIFSGKKEETRPASKRVGTPTPRPTVARPEATQPPPESSVGESGAMNSKQLAREMGSGDPMRREEAARQLAATGSPTGLRPLMNCYLNYGDPGVLEALKIYGKDLAPPATREAFDLSVMGARRARLMDVLGISGEESSLSSVRPNMDDPDLDIHIRSCVALARLGDMFGIDRLEEDVRLTDSELRSRALSALVELKNERADRVLHDHVKRYMAEAGAVPDSVVVKAPLLESSETSLTNAVVAEVKASSQNLVLVIGSGATQLVSNRRDALAQAMAGHGPVFFGLPLMPPEEQIANLRQAHAAATAEPGASALFLGRLPAPHDSPPLPHFITRVEGVSYSVKIIIVDLHEYSLLQDWLYYVQDKAEAPTEIELVLSLNLAGQGGLSDEERMIYGLCSAEEKARFPRAYMARG